MTPSEVFAPDRITAALLREECGYGDYDRGKGYYHQGRTELTRVEAQDGVVHLLATTRGSGRNRYRYRQDIDIDDIDGILLIEGECSCPAGFNCKHVVAACLAYKHRAPAQQAETADLSAFSHWLNTLDAAALGGGCSHRRAKTPITYRWVLEHTH